MAHVNAAAVALLAVAAAAKVPTLAQPLTENFAWRQTQTAWTALIYHREGIDLLHPQVPVHGPPWTFGFEFPLFQALGALLMDVGFATDTAMRLLGLATFLVTAWLAYRLALRLAGPVAAIASLVAFLFSPFGVLWGRTSLIEYLATAAAIGFLLMAMRWLEERRTVDLAAAGLLATVAMLVKITTGAFYLLPILAYRGRDGRYGVRDWPILVVIAMAALLGRAWIAYTDALKTVSPATVFQTSGQMIDFNFGSLAMRLEPATWAPIGAVVLVGLGGTAILVCAPMTVRWLRTSGQPRFVVALAASAIALPPIVLTPLYSTQGYYPAAISPIVALVLGLGIGWAWACRGTLVGRAALLTSVALWVLTLVLTRSYWMDSYRPVVDRDGALAAADFIRARTDVDDWVVIWGRGWDPTVLYYADRRGYALDVRRDDADTIDRLRATGDYALFVNCPYERRCEEIGE